MAMDDNSQLLALYDQHQRINLEIPDVRKEITPDVVRFIRPAPGMNFVAYAWLDDFNADAVIQEQINYFMQFDQPFTWQVMDHDLPRDLHKRLLAHGFSADDGPGAVMFLDLQKCDANLLQPVSLEIRRVTEFDGLDDVVEIEEQVWGGSFTWLKQRLGSHLAIPDYLSVYVAYVDERPSGAAWTYFPINSPFASLFGGATIPKHRKSGLYSGLLAQRVQEARQRGRRYLTVGCNANSRPIVARNGFQFLAYHYDYELNRSAVTG